MRKDVYYAVCAAMLAVGLRTVQSTDECITPKNQDGICINILDCQALQSTILEYRKNIESYNLIKASFCGYEGRTTKVCCPLEPLEPSNSPDVDEAPSLLSSSSSSILPSKSTCGKVEVNHDRIVGGKPASLGAWPWIAVLGYRFLKRENFGVQWACGGSLISNRHVLTAAHCTVNTPGRVLSVVRLGELDLNPTVNDGASPLDVLIEMVLSHEEYNPQQLVNDIAVLKLRDRVTFGRLIQPICLLEPSDMNKVNFARSMPYVAGWGSTNANPSDDLRFPPNTMLMEVQVPIQNSTQCKKLYEKQYKFNVIDDRVVCAGYPKGGKDSCRGDSGGPLMWPMNQQYFLMGVVSYGTQVCGQPGFPGVYSRVSSYIDWIEQKIQL